MKNYYYIIVFIISLLNLTCKEPYTPEISTTTKLLVVEGLITDDPATNHIIYLSHASPFKSQSYMPESGATVSVIDENGIQYRFQETNLGEYRLEPKVFTPQYGKSYYLYIKTKNGNRYRSSNQKLYPKAELNEISKVYKKKTFQTYIKSEPQLLTAVGYEMLTVLNTQSEPSPYYRFVNTLMLEYSSFNSLDTITSFCWMKYELNNYFNISNIENNNSGQVQHDLGFCPVDSSYFSILHEYFRDKDGYIVGGIDKQIYYIVLSFKQFHINEDIHKYYKQVNEQLEAKQKIFDPVSSQCKGNITCLTNPNEVVLGIFEVASVSIKSYIFQFQQHNMSNLKQVAPIDMNKIPASSCSKYERPYFWINYK